MLQALIGEFEDLCSDLLSAVRRGDERVVNRIDAQIQPCLERIFRFRAGNSDEAICQLQFFARLAVRNSEDDDSVSRYTNMMTALFNRYLDLNTAFPHAPGDVDAGLTRSRARHPNHRKLAHGYDPSVQELLLDSMPERIALVGLDYRYIFTNRRNGDFHGKPPSYFVGKHLSEMIEAERFRERAKPKLDQCFSGEAVQYDYRIADPAGRTFDVDCRMVPYIGADNAIAGAVIVLKMHPLPVRVG